MRTEFRRVKHGQMPDDVSRKIKIAMRERRTPIKLGQGYVIGENCAKSFRKDLLEKSKTAQRRRDKEAIKKGLEE